MLANDCDSLWDTTSPDDTGRRAISLIHRCMKPRLPRGLRTLNSKVVDLLKSSLDVFSVQCYMEEANGHRCKTALPLFARHEVALFGVWLVVERIQSMIHTGRTKNAHGVGDDACPTDLLQLVGDMLRYRFEDVLQICTIDDLVDQVVDTMSLHIGVDVDKDLVASYVCHVAPHTYQPCELLRMAFLSCDCIVDLVGHTLAKTLRCKLAHEW